MTYKHWHSEVWDQIIRLEGPEILRDKLDLRFKVNAVIERAFYAGMTPEAAANIALLERDRVLGLMENLAEVLSDERFDRPDE